MEKDLIEKMKKDTTLARECELVQYAGDLTTT